MISGAVFEKESRLGAIDQEFLKGVLICRCPYQDFNLKGFARHLTMADLDLASYSS